MNRVNWNFLILTLLLQQNPHFEPTKADIHLNKYNAVIGPSSDGGLYLIGLNAKFFQRQLIEKLSWESAFAAMSFINYLQQMNASFILSQVKDDIDCNADLLQILKNKTISFILRNRISSILASIKAYSAAFLQNLIIADYRIYTSLRAPPFP